MGRNYYKALILCLLLVACKKDRPGEGASLPVSRGADVFIVCEGNFGNSNATLYAYDRQKDSAYGDLYNGTNHATLGDVFQSMAKVAGQFFLCVNNSDKVVVLNPGSLLVTDVVHVPKPRYMLAMGETKMYISSEYSNNVYVADPQTHRIMDTIKLPCRNTEGMCAWGNYIFVCAWDTACKSVYKVDAGSNKIVQTIEISGYAPQEILLDKEGMAWVLSGNRAQGRTCALTRFDPASGSVRGGYVFAPDVDAIKPVFNPTRDTLYFIEANYNGDTVNNGIYRMSITGLVPQLFVAAKQFQYFWGLGIDPQTGYVYAGDPKGFVQKGSVYMYRQDATQLKRFDVGIGPGHFYFDQ